ncbi:Mus38-like protein [Staphylotrichum tortipilum]|uniref:Mus38-like protein n=1 Tax=Staphylotrichum tortipilum TaxID=2831512 RepID=A0AAN6MM26_9PEZI|nr:Mus38-like protein [Staphylotrichum longicolle]
MLDERISSFFTQAGACTSKTECDTYAATIFGGPSPPVPDQGAWSYTVTAGPDNNTIVQFRELDSPLDVETLAAAHSIHPDLVARCVSHGTIGSPPGLLVYSMPKLPGETYLRISATLRDDDFTHRFTTVLGLAECVHSFLLNPSSPLLPPLARLFSTPSPKVSSS